MGIDAKMLVKAAKVRTDKEIRRLSFEMGEAFRGEFYGYRPGDRHFLSAVDEYEQDGPTIRATNGEQLIEVHLMTRYYGPEYERGDLPTILAVAKWLQCRIPDGDVWYGGDSSGVCAEKLTPTLRDELWQHFAEHGHRPYTGFFEASDLERAKTRAPDDPGLPRPVCEFCGGVPMERYGSGPNYAAFRCAGCGDHVIRRDGTERWQSRGEIKRSELL